MATIRGIDHLQAVVVLRRLKLFRIDGSIEVVDGEIIVHVNVEQDALDRLARNSLEASKLLFEFLEWAENEFVNDHDGVLEYFGSKDLLQGIAMHNQVPTEILIDDGDNLIGEYAVPYVLSTFGLLRK
jgi:hypothetical protein